MKNLLNQSTDVIIYASVISVNRYECNMQGNTLCFTLGCHIMGGLIREPYKLTLLLINFC